MNSATRLLDYGERGTVQVVTDGTALAEMAAELVMKTVNEIAVGGLSALVALSGGSTPKLMGTLFAAEPLIDRVQWGSLEVFWGDQRWVPLDDPESNAGEAMRTFLNHVPIPLDQVHPFETEGIDPEQSACNLEQEIRDLRPGAATPRFDLILLGMGDDGHTASLFPGAAAIHETERLVVSHGIDKLNVTRLTFTPPLINAANKVAFLVGGEGKAEMLATVLDGPIDADATPAQVVRPHSGDLYWIVDEAAATLLGRYANRE
jgi:6-phosphogluconolactonase